MKNKEILRRVFGILKPFKVKLGIAIVAMIVVSAMTGVQAKLVKDLLDKIFLEKNDFFLNLLPLIVIVVFGLKSIAYYTYSFFLEVIGQTVIRDLRIQLFTHIHSQPLSFFSTMPTGSLISRIISDITLMQQAVSNALVNIIRDFFQVIILLGYVFYTDWQMAMFTFVILPIAGYPIVKFGRLFRQYSTRSQEETANVSNMLYETITGNRTIKAFCKEQYESGRFKNQIGKLFSVTIAEGKFRCIQHPIMEMIGGIAFAFILWYGGKQVIGGESTVGTFFSFLTALMLAYDPIKGISRINSTIQQGMAAANRVFSLLDIEPEITDTKDAIVLPPFRSSIHFKNLSFSYKDEESVLNDINLEVRAGEALAIVGPSGGGKTTLTNLIPRFLEVTDGEICIDETNIKTCTLKSLRSQIGMVTQQTILFNDTVKNNIAYGDLEATEEQIVNAAKAAHAFSFIEGLPKGFDTIIGEGGSRLSGGERQRISIARAILKNAPILILDEATSALDTESEREVQKALENLMKNRTTLVIAHRLSTIKNADRIIVIKDGRIVEEGTHEALLALHGEYELLHNIQNY
jgi:subfamily B ATP-binding cassette protein MsbA